jgi:hypothetical protein
MNGKVKVFLLTMMLAGASADAMQVFDSSGNRTDPMTGEDGARNEHSTMEHSEGGVSVPKVLDADIEEILKNIKPVDKSNLKFIFGPSFPFGPITGRPLVYDLDEDLAL